MKRKIFMLGILLYLVGSTNYSQINYDSLYQTVKQIGNATEQIEYLDNMLDDAAAERMVTYDSLYHYLIELYRSQDNLDDEVRTAAGLAYHYYLIYEDQKAAAIVDEYQADLERIGDPLVKAFALHKFGIILKTLNRKQDALNYFNRAIALFEEVNDSTQENYANALIERGSLLVAQGDFAKSSITLNRAKGILEYNQDSAGLRIVYEELFILFSQIELYEEAEKYADLALSYVPPDTNLGDFQILTINSARNLVMQEKFDEASAKYLSLESQAVEHMKLYLYNGLIESLYFGQRRDSIGYYFQLLNQAYDDLNRRPDFEFLFLQSRFLHRLNNKLYTLARQDGEKLMDHAIAINDVAEIMMYNRFLAELHYQMGDFGQAYQYATAYNKSRDSIQAVNKSQALLLYQTQYETAEKENQIAQLNLNTQLLESRISRNQLMRILLLAILGILLLTAAVVYHRLQIRQLAKMQELRTSISSDLHDEVGSLLSGISMQADIVETVPNEDLKKKMVKEIGSNTRKAITTMRDLVWSIDSRKDRIKHLKDKIIEACSKLLSSKKFTYSVDIDDQINEERQLNPRVKKEIYLICKEALHNIQRHSNGDQVEIQLKKTSQNIQLLISDNGTPAAAKIIPTGQGLDNMRRRAKAVGGNLEIKRSTNRFQIQLNVPL